MHFNQANVEDSTVTLSRALMGAGCLQFPEIPADHAVAYVALHHMPFNGARWMESLAKLLLFGVNVAILLLIPEQAVLQAKCAAAWLLARFHEWPPAPICCTLNSFLSRNTLNAYLSKAPGFFDPWGLWFFLPRLIGDNSFFSRR